MRQTPYVVHTCHTSFCLARLLAPVSQCHAKSETAIIETIDRGEERDMIDRGRGAHYE